MSAGADLRPNNALAGVAGSSGLARAGRGLGSSVPRSCAASAPHPAISRTALRASRETKRIGVMSHFYPRPASPAIAGRSLWRRQHKTELMHCIRWARSLQEADVAELLPNRVGFDAFGGDNASL